MDIQRDILNSPSTMRKFSKNKCLISLFNSIRQMFVQNFDLFYLSYFVVSMYILFAHLKCFFFLEVAFVLVLIAFALTQKARNRISCCFFSFFLHLVRVTGRTCKSFFAYISSFFTQSTFTKCRTYFTGNTETF